MTEALWYALKVRPRSEWIVGTNLQQKGYELFLPTYASRRRWSDRVKTVELPVFPGYLFCRFDVRTRLPILTTPGVSFIVGSGRSPEPIAESEVEAIRTLVASGLPYDPCSYITVGQRVQIERGSLAGLTGLVTEVRNEFRLIMSVDLLMRSVSVQIDRTWVKTIANEPGERSQPAASGVVAA